MNLAQVRNAGNQKGAGEADRLSDDHGGHLIARIFDGTPLKFNLIAQNGNLNLSAYKKVENRWRRALEADQSVEVTIDVMYDGASRRPSQFTVKESIDEESTLASVFWNRKGGV